jgi:hypothetical protein
MAERGADGEEERSEKVPRPRESGGWSELAEVADEVRTGDLSRRG